MFTYVDFMRMFLLYAQFVTYRQAYGLLKLIIITLSNVKYWNIYLSEPANRRQLILLQ